MFQSDNKMSLECKINHVKNSPKRILRKMMRQMNRRKGFSTKTNEGERQYESKFLLKPSKLSGVLPSESGTFLDSAPAKLENSPEMVNQVNFQQAASRAGFDLRTQNYTTTGLPSSHPLENKSESKCQFPELIIFRGYETKSKAPLFLKRSFSESPYGPLSLRTWEVKPGLIKVSMWWNDQCLAEGEGKSKKEAEAAAVLHLYNKLTLTNYIIELKRDYIPRRGLPPHVRNVDPNNFHILKVVCLKKPDGPNFPNLSGAVDYVSSEPDLWTYVKNHINSQSKADIFVLNIEKDDRKIVLNMCREKGMLVNYLLGCSDRGVVASRKENVKELLQELKDCGGETIKYRLIPPGSGSENIKIKEEINNEGEECDNQLHNVQRPKNLEEEEEEIVISPWISNNLILIDYFNETSQLETAKELLFLAVKNNSNLDEFIIEKSFHEVTGKITARAKIDKHVVGIAKGFNVAEVKKDAAENALKNLKKCCNYIEGKQSYFGLNGGFPEFLSKRVGNDNNRTALYRIANHEVALHQSFRKFRSSPAQDLFFLDNFPFQSRKEVGKIAKQMGFLVRTFSRQYVCVQKPRKPKQIYDELMSTMMKENEKYKLHIPPIKLGQPPIGFISNQVQGRLQGLFDISEKDVKPVFKEQIPSSLSQGFQNKPKKEVPTVDRSDVCSWKKQNVIQGDFKNTNLGSEEQASLHRKGNKRSFQQGPGDKAVIEPVQIEKQLNQQSNQPWESGNRSTDQRCSSWKEQESNNTMLLNQGQNFKSSEQIQTTSTNNKSYDFEEDIWLESLPEDFYSSVRDTECEKSNWQTDQARSESQHTALASLREKEPVASQDVKYLGTQVTGQSQNKDKSSAGQWDADSSYGKKSRFSAPTNLGEPNQQEDRPCIKDTQFCERKPSGLIEINLNQSSKNTDYRGIQQQRDQPTTKYNQSYCQENQQYGWEKKEESVLPSLWSENMHSRESNQQTHQSWSKEYSGREPYDSREKLVLPNTINRSVNVRESNEQVDRQQTRIQSYGQGSYQWREKEAVFTHTSGESTDSTGLNKHSGDSSVPKSFGFTPNIREPQKNIDILTNQYNNRPPVSGVGNSDLRGSEQIRQSWNRTDNSSNQRFDVKSNVRCEKNLPSQNSHCWMGKDLERPSCNPLDKGQFNQRTGQTFNRDTGYSYHESREKFSVTTDAFDKRTEKNEPNHDQVRNLAQLFDLRQNVQKSQQQTNEFISKDKKLGEGKFGSSKDRVSDFREPSKRMEVNCTRREDLNSFGQTTSQVMPLIRDNRWTSGNRLGSWRDNSDLNQQAEQTRDRQDGNRSSGQRKRKSSEKERPFNQSSGGVGSNSHSGHLWNKDNKRFYDQRPEFEEKRQADFTKHFDGVTPKDFSRPTPDMPSSRYQEKIRGHSFSKMNKYVLNAKNK